MKFVCVIILITKVHYFHLQLQIGNYIKYNLFYVLTLVSTILLH
jgi:hypothetical protein